MKFPKRKHPRLKEYDYSNDGGYFVTVCVKNKEKLLGEPVLVNGKIKLTPIGETAEKHIKAINSAYDGVRVDSYMIMPDHIHMLITISGGMPSCRRLFGFEYVFAGGLTPPSRLRRATSPKVEAICVSKYLIYTQNPPFREGFFFLPVPLSKTCAKGVKALSKLWQKVARQVPKHYI